MKAGFGGCIRELKLNDEAIGNEPKEFGIAPCNRTVESGLYFGQEGGYVVLNDNFKVITNMY